MKIRRKREEVTFFVSSGRNDTLSVTMNLLTVLVLLAIFPLTSLPAQEPAETLFNRGEEYLQSKNYTEAIKQFEKAVSLKPEWAEAHFKLGMAHSSVPPLDKDRPAHIQAAIKAFEAAIRLRPNWAEAHNELGLRIMSSGSYDDAIDAFKQAIRYKPEFAEAHKNLAIPYLYTGRFKEGIEQLNESIRIKPDLASAHKLLGSAYLAMDKRDEAMQVYNVLKPLDAEMANFLLAAIQRPEKFVFGVKQGKLISNPKPFYPDAARINRVSGQVTVHVVINEQGNVTSAKAVSGPVELREAAEAAALQARFTPTLLSGQPVTVNGSISYNFVPR